MDQIDKSIIACPFCGSSHLEFYIDKIACQQCSSGFVLKNNKMYFNSLTASDISNPIDRIKFFFKKYRRFYSMLKSLISPVYIESKLNRFLKRNGLNKENVIINIGSGNSKINNSIINIDMFDYENVDIVCNIEHLPFIQESIDIVINKAVLEHVPCPEAIVSEIKRVLKPGGLVYCFFPFIQGFHASPNDYSRRTIEGLRILYKDFEEVEVKAAGGPTSGFLWIFQEWLAIILSFGCVPIYRILYIIIMALTWPLKFLDIVFIKHPMAKNISSGFVYIGRKK